VSSKLELFRSGLSSTSVVLSEGIAAVLGHDVPALLVRNLYGQEIVWGEFGCNRGKFKGGLSNNAATEDVYYTAKEDI
jgi:hypothetical protein